MKLDARAAVGAQARRQGGEARGRGSRSRCGPASRSSATSRRSATLGVRDDRASTLGPWETFWILFYGFATYGNAGWMREQVCKYMCPYARFQSAMFDRDTLIITYDRERGEPRGSRSRKADPQGRRPRRLRRLQHLRAGLPDRHRHPQGPAVRVHRLRRVHRRLRPGDGQDGLSAGARSATRPRTRSRGTTITARCGSACSARARSSTPACSRSSSSRPACRWRCAIRSRST